MNPVRSRLLPAAMKPDTHSSSYRAGVIGIAEPVIFMRILVSVFLLNLSTLLAHAASYAPAPTAAINWTPNVAGGVGVPGGIPNRTTVFRTIASTGDTTDRRDAIRDALIACPVGQVVLLGPGTFYLSQSLTLANVTSYYQHDPTYPEYTGVGGKTLRGSGSDPSTGTVIKMVGNVGIGTNGGQFQNGPGGNVTGSPAKGAATLNVTNSGSAIVGRQILLAYENDDTMPVFSTRGYQFLKTQVALITAVNTGAGTITIQPALYQAPVKRIGGGALAMQWGMSHGRAVVSGFGVEDLCIDNTSGSGSTNLGFSGAHGSWMKNVRAKGVNRYGLSLMESTQCEIRQCWIEQNTRGDWTGSSHAGLNLANVSASLIEDNVILPNFPLIESQNGNISGNVIAYNFGLQGINNVSFSSHSTGDYCNLWEGNSASNLTQDGYFGGTSDNVVFRNDWHGVILGSSQPHWPIQLNRGARFWEVVGNQLGRTGTTIAIELGRPNAFNGNWTGRANNLTGNPHIDFSLTGIVTRLADNSYTILMDTTKGQMVVGQWPMTMRWGAYGGSFRSHHVITGISALTVSLGDDGQNNSFGNVPPTGTVVRLWPGENSGFQEWDDAVAHSTVLLGNYYAKDGQIPSGQALGATTLPASLFRGAKPAFMDGYNWPPYDPQSPDLRYQAIPAGARYLGGASQPPQAKSAPATVRISR